MDYGLVESALTEQQHVRELRDRRRTETMSTSIRVPTRRLDKLVDLVGELVIVQARLSRTAQQVGRAELGPIAEEVEHLAAELRENTMGIRY